MERSDKSEMFHPESNLYNLPVHNKDNFRVYHDDKSDSAKIHSRSAIRQRSIYPTVPDIPTEPRIVNEPRPEVTLRYLRVRGEQYGLKAKDEDKNPAKRKRNVH